MKSVPRIGLTTLFKHYEITIENKENNQYLQISKSANTQICDV